MNQSSMRQWIVVLMSLIISFTIVACSSASKEYAEIVNEDISGEALGDCVELGEYKEIAADNRWNNEI
ncbi:MAG: hypothetical protein ACK5LL_14325 [Suipraeoptans sp.]